MEQSKTKTVCRLQLLNQSIFKLVEKRDNEVQVIFRLLSIRITLKKRIVEPNKKQNKKAMEHVNELVNEHFLVLSESYEYMSHWVGIYEKYAGILKGDAGNPEEVVSGKAAESANDKIDLTNKHLQLKVLLEEFCDKLKRRNNTVSETFSLTEAHADRHRSFSSLQMNIKSKVNFGTEQSMAAAVRILTQTDNFKISLIKTRADMSASISGYIAILRQSKNTTDVALLDIAERITDTENKNTIYMDLERKRGVVKKEKGRSASIVYRDCYKSFNQLTDLVNCVFFYYDNDQFTAFANELNGITDGYQYIINKRNMEAKRKKEGKDVKPS